MGLTFFEDPKLGETRRCSSKGNGWPGKCPILRLRNFFTVLSTLAQLTSDPFSFLWWSSTTKVLNRYQPPMRMKVRLCEDVNIGYSDSRGPVNTTEKFCLAETKSLLPSKTPSTESLRRIAGPRVYAAISCPLPPAPAHEQQPSDTFILLRHKFSAGTSEFLLVSPLWEAFYSLKEN